MSFDVPLIPRTTGSYLTEQLFSRLGFFTGTANSTQIQLAFALGEIAVEQMLGTYLQPTVFTGVYADLHWGDRAYAPVGILRRINSVTFHERFSDAEDRLISGSGAVLGEREGAFSVMVSPNDVSSSVGSYSEGIYKVEVSMTAGFQSGTWQHAQIQLAMCIAADVYLKYLTDSGALDDENLQFIRRYSMGRYSQDVLDRFVLPTPLGTGGKGQIVRSLLSHWTVTRSGKLGK